MNRHGAQQRKYDFFLIALLLLSLAVFIAELYFVSNSNMLGSRAAEYGALADNLLKGKGFVLDYIDQYYIKFDSIPHPLEWDYPMMGILIAPFIFLFGKTALAVKLPTMIIGTILLPILTYYLGKEFFGKKIAFLSAVSVLFYSRALELTYAGQRDTAFAFFALCGVYFFYKALQNRKMKHFYLMGFFLGISYLIRGTALLILPALLIAYYLIKKRIDLRFINGILFAVLVMSPWLIRNYFVFGDPLFTANKYAQWIAAWFTDYEFFGYEVYWYKLKPSFAWLMSLPIEGGAQSFGVIKVLNNFAAQMEELLVLTLTTFVGLLAILKEKLEKKFLIFAALIIIIPLAVDRFISNVLNIATIYAPFPLFPYLMVVIFANLKSAKENEKIRVFALIWLAFALFHGVFVIQGGLRFLLILVPFLFILSWKGAEKALELAQGKVKAISKIPIEKMLLLVLVIFILVNTALIYKSALKKEPEGILPDLINRATEKDAVIMACNVQPLAFYTGRKFVEVPGDNIIRFAEVIDTYNVSYVTFSGCGIRAVYPQVANIFFRQTTVPNEGKNFLYKIKLEISGKNEDLAISLNPLLVAGIDKDGKKFWTTGHLRN